MAQERIKDQPSTTTASGKVFALDGLITESITYENLITQLKSDILSEVPSNVGQFLFTEIHPSIQPFVLKLDGGTYSKADYVDLVALWDSVYGIDGANLPSSNNWYDNPADRTKFRVPDFYTKGLHLRAPSILYGYTQGQVVIDAMQPIIGLAGREYLTTTDPLSNVDGAFRSQPSGFSSSLTSGGAGYQYLNFDSSRVTRTADETRPNSFVANAWVVAKAYNTLDPTPPNMVTSFNGRIGDVIPATNDYNATQIAYNSATVGSTLDTITTDVTAVKSALNGVTKYTGVADNTIASGDVVKLVYSGTLKVAKATNSSATLGVALNSATAGGNIEVAILGVHSITTTLWTAVAGNFAMISPAGALTFGANLLHGYRYIGIVINVSGTTYTLEISPSEIINTNFSRIHNRNGATLNLADGATGTVPLPTVLGTDNEFYTIATDVINLKRKDISINIGVRVNCQKSTGGAATQVYAWLESSTDGTTWAGVATSLRLRTLNNNLEVEGLAFDFIFERNVTAPTFMRVRIRPTGNSLSILEPTALAGMPTSFTTKLLVDLP